ncbi:MAG: hypothetical protein HYY76_10335 [Acidobacteria bacterium]|nr:hypothetical protein [Acidobacteriota bacterium]
MTWKSYAAVSGATVLAGWLASASPSNAPVQTEAPSRPQPAPASGTASDIEQQAMRLQARLRAERGYTEPARDPFRFAPRRAPMVVRERPVAEAPVEPIDTAPPAPVVSLSGIAEDRVDGRIERTAVLSSPQGVLLVREGDEILGYYRVARIENEAVELVPLGDGAPRRLTFK